MAEEWDVWQPAERPIRFPSPGSVGLGRSPESLRPSHWLGRRAASAWDVRLGFGAAAALVATAFYTMPFALIELLAPILGWGILLPAALLALPDVLAVMIGAGWIIRLLTRGIGGGVSTTGMVLATLGALVCALFAQVIPSTLEDPARIAWGVAMLGAAVAVALLAWDADLDRRSARAALLPTTGPVRLRDALALLVPIGLSIAALAAFTARAVIRLSDQYGYYGY